ncbi:MAG: efflux RND transporter periplasmic adaptor subunit, partial [Bacteroidetes bacterium QH_2_63_10]
MSAVLLVAGCSNGEASDEASQDRSPQAPRVETLQLEPTSFTDIIEVTGSVQALNDAELSAQTSGTVTTMADRGARIESGEPVA